MNGGAVQSTTAWGQGCVRNARELPALAPAPGCLSCHTLQRHTKRRNGSAPFCLVDGLNSSSKPSGLGGQAHRLANNAPRHFSEKGACLEHLRRNMSSGSSMTQPGVTSCIMANRGGIRMGWMVYVMGVMNSRHTHIQLMHERHWPLIRLSRQIRKAATGIGNALHAKSQRPGRCYHISPCRRLEANRRGVFDT